MSRHLITLNGLEIWAMLGENFDIWFTIPLNLCSSVTGMVVSLLEWLMSSVGLVKYHGDQ